MAAEVVNAAASDGARVVTSLYVANLDANVTDSQLYDLFSQIGNVVSIRVMRDFTSGLSLGYGYVNYGNAQCAHRALEELNFTPLNGKPIMIMCSHIKPSMSKSSSGNVYIKNLDMEINQKALHEIFSSFGNILSCKVAKNASGQSMGYGFVQFDCEESAKRAIGKLNGTLLNGKRVHVGSYLSKQERQLLVDKENVTNVFVKNFCESTTEDDLKIIFGEFGLIISTLVMRNEDGTSKCFGFVNFANAEDAARAVESLNGQIFDKKKWYVGRAQKKFERQLELKHHLECVKEAFDKGSNLYVKNLDDSISDKKLKELFSPFGTVTSCGVMRDKNGLRTGRALVAFSSPEEASRALSEVNGKILLSKRLYVALAQRKEDRRARLQNLDKKTDHKALPETFLSSGNTDLCKVAADSSGQSMGYSFVHFAGEESAQKAIKEHNGMPLDEKQLCVGRFLSKQERELSIDEANFTNVFVKNLCESTTEDDLRNIFGEFGSITSTVVMRNEDGTSKHFGFVSFENSEDAARAVESLNGQKSDKKKWYVGRALKKFDRLLELKQHIECVKEAFDKGSNLYVKNLDDSIGDEKLKELFSPLGTVTSCKVMRDKEGLSTGKGVVAFLSPEEASKANLDKEIGHKALHETFASSCKVATDASGQSMGYDFVQFAGVESAQKGIAELNGIVGKLNGFIGELNDIVGKLNGFIGELNGVNGELNGIIGELHGMLLNGKQVYGEPCRSKQEDKLLVYKANFTGLFVKNICESTTEDDLKNLFGEFGSITSTVVMRNEDGTSICFGFVNFENAEDATRAVESLNGQKFNKNWWFERAQKKCETELELKKSFKQCVKAAVDKGSNLPVKNLDDSIDNEKLKELFSPFGSVTSCKVMQDQEGISKGSGCVAFSSPEEAYRAISEMNGKILVSKPLYVALAQKKEDRRAQLQSLDKDIDHKALPESFSSTEDTLLCKVATDASGQSAGYGFSSEEYAQKSIGEHNDMPLNEKQVGGEPSLSRQELELSTDEANTMVLVKNFYESTTEDDLKKIFGEFGSITSTVVMKNEDGTSKCFGFVSFQNAEDAARAVESLNSQIFDKKKWYVGRAQKKFEKQLELKHHIECVKEAVDKGSDPYVNNLDKSTGCRKLTELFPPFHSVTSCKVMRDQKGISRGKGLVGLSTPEEASGVLSEMDDKILVRKPLHVAIAQRKENRRTRLQPGSGYQELFVPGMRPAAPLMPNTFVPLVQQQQQGSRPGRRCTNAGLIQKHPHPAPAMPLQMLPKGRGYCYPPGGMFPVQNEMAGLPLRYAVMSQPIPVESLASLLANVSSPNRGRCLVVKMCTRLLKTGGSR